MRCSSLLAQRDFPSTPWLSSRLWFRGLCNSIEKRWLWRNNRSCQTWKSHRWKVLVDVSQLVPLCCFLGYSTPPENTWLARGEWMCYSRFHFCSRSSQYFWLAFCNNFTHSLLPLPFPTEPCWSSSLRMMQNIWTWAAANSLRKIPILCVIEVPTWFSTSWSCQQGLSQIIWSWEGSHSAAVWLQSTLV